jgi:hypothetical protein
MQSGVRNACDVRREERTSPDSAIISAFDPHRMVWWSRGLQDIPGGARAERTRMGVDPVAQLLSDPRFKGQPITWGVTSEGYDAIRRAWLTHVHAEEVLFKPFTEDEFQTQMQVMLSVFTDDCVMELVPAGKRWEGRTQAAEFYRVFLSSLQEMQWAPQALVIGPQGVLDVVNMTGKLVKAFAGLKDVGAQVHLQWVIYFSLGAVCREV